MSPTGSIDLRVLLTDLASRDVTRTEADVQAGIKALLLAGGFNLDADSLEASGISLESPSGKGRIDIEAGCTVIEVKKDLRVGNVRPEGVDQLAGYVRERRDHVAQRYVGVLTDGAEWNLYHLEGDELSLVNTFVSNPMAPDVEGLLLWLEGILATAEQIHPTPREIEARLGAQSSAHALDAADLGALYDAYRDLETVKLKRELWGRLLTTALGTNFEDSDQLFVNHSLLVLTAKVIAHAVLEYQLTDPVLTPEAICSGSLFTNAQIYGVIESDFFDWPLEVPGGQQFIRTLAHRLARFAWDFVEHDVMKVLYESVISAQQRHDLGEYYTPDWLAERVVATAVTEPLSQQVLDPACGSGTFLFHSVRRFLNTADEEGMENSAALTGVCRAVSGIDVHPVAVTLARVTYLLAIGKSRLRGDRGELLIPVYLGDSIQWDEEMNLLTSESLVVETTAKHGWGQGSLLSQPLNFPRKLLADPVRFDQLVEELARKAANRKPGSKPSLNAAFRLFAIDEADQPIIESTFRTMCELHDIGRNHIWGYFVRNLARPVWQALPENQVDVLVGNPPWLSYRFMPDSMQKSFRKMSEERKLWAGSAVSTHQDLSGLFLVRACELYLRPGGQFGFVMPLAVLSRRQFAGLRGGDYPLPTNSCKIAFTTPWDLHKVKPSIFPVPPAVVFGSRSETASGMPASADEWSGRVKIHNASWESVSEVLTVSSADSSHMGPATGGPLSPYASRFSQGATIVPRVLFVVADAPASPLGVGAGRRAVQPRRSANEKRPWKDIDLEPLVVETRFIFPMHLGETLLPFRLLEPLEVVLPWDGERLLDDDDDALDYYAGLSSWWKRSNSVWRANRSSDRLSLLERIDYQKGLSQQFPLPAHRVVYNASGMYLAAARLNDPKSVIDTKLYWSATNSIEEAQYLTAIMNSDAFTLAVRPLQSRGEHNPRDFHKYIFEIPFPAFDPKISLHQKLVEAAAHAEDVVAGVELPTTSFQSQRRTIRHALSADGVAKTLDGLVAELISAP
jgi:hypothetical protein